MEISFEKWHGTGNDFIMIDDRAGRIPRNPEWIKSLCARHVGIGSDGLIFIKNGKDYEMDFYNPDGSQSFCGNGSRCAFAFYSSLVNDRNALEFLAIDGAHKASWLNELVRIEMRDVHGFEVYDETIDFINTGSPHLVVWVEDPMALDIIAEAHKYRYNERFKAEGVNVNFVSWQNNKLLMRTYERGVEGETLSCGTGVTAAGLSAMRRGKVQKRCKVITKGGNLEIEVASFDESTAQGIALIGPVQKVFDGKISLP